MSDRLTDDQIRQALVRRSRAYPPEDLRMDILSTAAGTTQAPLRQPWRLRARQPAIRLVYVAVFLALLAPVVYANLPGRNDRSAVLPGGPTASPAAPTLRTATPSATSVAPAPTPPASATAPAKTPASDEESQTAVATVSAYEKALAARDFRAAWDLRAGPSRAGQTLESFSTERTQFLASTKGEFAVRAPDNAPAHIDQWLAPGVTDGVDRSRAFLVEVDFPALAGNNAGYEIFLVSPDAGGDWRLWEVR